MKPIIRTAGILLSFTVSIATASAANWTEGMQEGKPALKSMGPLAFGPEGILLIADTKGAAVVAVATGDITPGTAKPLKVEGINQKVAALIGTAADQILIDDMAVNPISRSVYLAVSRGRGPDATPVLVRVKPEGQIEIVSLDKVKFARGEGPGSLNHGWARMNTDGELGETRISLIGANPD